MHRIISANKEHDKGRYECSVNVTLDEYPNKPLDSEVAVANLTVYGEYTLFTTILLNTAPIVDALSIMHNPA